MAKGNKLTGKMTMGKFESTPMDKAKDKKLAAKGIKEGSKTDKKADRAAVAKINKKRGY